MPVKKLITVKQLITKDITQEVIKLTLRDNCDIFYGTVSEVLENIKDIKAYAVSLGFPEDSVEFETNVFPNENQEHVDVTLSRYETDEEVKERIAMIEARKQLKKVREDTRREIEKKRQSREAREKEDADYRIYLRLKKRFEKEENQ